MTKPAAGSFVTDLGGWTFVASTKSKYADNAAKFAVWAAADNVELMVRYNSYGKFSASQGISVISKLSEVYNKGLKKKFTEVINPVGRYELALPPEVVDIIGDAIRNCRFKNGKGAEEARITSDRIDEFLKTYSGGF